MHKTKMAYLPMLYLLLIVSGPGLLLTACGDSSISPQGIAPPIGEPPGVTPPPVAWLPSVVSGQKPGPALLYAAAPKAPQLENVAPWTAAPILVSGTSAYREGEFLYQDYLHDDRGAAGAQDPNDPFLLGGDHLFSPKAGTLTYPSDTAIYANNAADFVELRVKPLSDATAFRVSLNTLIDPARVGFTIALGSSATALAWPNGAGVSSPAQYFLTVHGDVIELRDAATSQLIAMPNASVKVDLERRQFDLRIPHSAWNPGTGKLRMAAGVGLWDATTNQYLQPSTTASATVPGGVAPSRSALFNLAFRYREPLPNYTVLGAAYTIGDAAAASAVEAKWWREFDQAAALRLGNVSAFFAEVDFATLLAKATDDSAVPKTGVLVRIFPSQFSFGQGIDFTRSCARSALTCEGMQIGQLQSYSLYVPTTKPQPAKGWGMTLLLHALSGTHTLYNGSKYQSQFGERASGSLVLTPGSRGPNGDYIDITEADVFEAWADVARHYTIDPDWAAIAGYSMGGGGTFKLGGRWPDLFGRAMSAAAVPIYTEGSYLPPFRNLPLLTWFGTADGLCAVNVMESIERSTAAGLDFTYDSFTSADHLTIYTNNEWGPAADWLGEHRVDRNPPHITYFVDPRYDSARAGMAADHAYWISKLTRRTDTAVGEIDVRSEAFGLGDAPGLGAVRTPAVLMGGAHGPMPYERTSQALGDVPKTPVADRLVVKATNMATITVDMQRAKLTCSAVVDVTTDGPLSITLAGCNRVLSLP
ncbi:MAG: hypothetical protein V4650_01300 [Pseudomonadota bacterium]